MKKKTPKKPAHPVDTDPISDSDADLFAAAGVQPFREQESATPDYRSVAAPIVRDVRLADIVTHPDLREVVYRRFGYMALPAPNYAAFRPAIVHQWGLELKFQVQESRKGYLCYGGHPYLDVARHVLPADGWIRVAVTKRITTQQIERCAFSDYAASPSVFLLNKSEQIRYTRLLRRLGATHPLGAVFLSPMTMAELAHTTKRSLSYLRKVI